MFSQIPVTLFSLGAIVRPNFQRGIAEMSKLIPHPEAAKLIGGVIMKNMALINALNINLSEDAFDERMVGDIKKATGVEVSRADFNRCWSLMSPSYEDFAAKLATLIEARRNGQQIIFLSNTNPKDLRVLVEKLKANNISYRIKNGVLVEIGGIILHATCTLRKNKAEVLSHVINQLQQESTSLLAKNSILTQLNQGVRPTWQIRLITTPNDIKDLAIKNNQDKNMTDLEQVAKTFGIEPMGWNGEESSLLELFSQPVSESLISRAL